MKIVADLSGQNTPVNKSQLIFSSAADMYKGDLVAAGQAVDSLGTIVPIATPAAPADVLGVLTQLHDYSDVGEYIYNGTLIDAAQNLVVDVDVRPGAIIRSQITTTTQILTANATDNVVLTTAVGAADVYGGCYCYDSTLNELRFVEDHDDTSGFTFNTATVGNWASGNTQLIIPQRLCGQKANQGMTYIKGTSTAEAKILVKGDESALWAYTLDMFYSDDNTAAALTRLLPKHDAKTLVNPKFFIDLVIRDHGLNPLS